MALRNRSLVISVSVRFTGSCAPWVRLIYLRLGQQEEIVRDGFLQAASLISPTADADLSPGFMLQDQMLVGAEDC